MVVGAVVVAPVDVASVSELADEPVSSQADPHVLDPDAETSEDSGPHATASASPRIPIDTCIQTIFYPYHSQPIGSRFGSRPGRGRLHPDG